MGLRGPKPEFEFTPEITEDIKEMAGVMTSKEIRVYFGVSKSVWYKRLSEHPEIKDIIKNGKPKKKWIAVNTIFKAMKNGGKEGVTAAIFYLKTQERWSEKREVEVSIPKLPDLPKSLGSDPIQAAQTYQKIMGGS